MRRFHSIFSLLFLAALLGACTSTPSERELALQAQLDSLQAQSQRKDSSLNEFIASMDYIQQNLDLLTSKERAVHADVTLATGDDTPQSNRDRIEQSMVEINDIMHQNRVVIARMEKLLKQKELKASGLHKLIDNMRLQVEQRDSTIGQLRVELGGLHYEIDSLSVAMGLLDSAYRAQTKSANEAWYAYGTKRELKENKIITRTGGFLGMGKRTELRDDINTDYFTRIDLSETESIPLMATSKGIRFLTPHPRSSYELERNAEGNIIGIRILDKEAFWRTSRFLVVLIR